MDVALAEVQAGVLYRDFAAVCFRVIEPSSGLEESVAVSRLDNSFCGVIGALQRLHTVET